MKLALRLAIIGYNIIKKQGLFELCGRCSGPADRPAERFDVVFYFFQDEIPDENDDFLFVYHVFDDFDLYGISASERVSPIKRRDYI